MNDCSIRFDEFLNDEMREQWNAFWSSSEHSFPRQHFLYGEVERSKRRTPIYVSGMKDGQVCFVGLFSVHPLWRHKCSFEAVCLRGPVYDDAAFGEWCLSETVQYFSGLGVGRVRIGPNWSFPEAERVEKGLFDLGFSIYETYHKMGRRSTGIVLIDQTDEDILRSFRKSTRYEIRKAERLNLMVRPADNYAEAKLFYKHLKRMCKERGVTCYGSAEFNAMYQSVLRSRELGIILNAYYNNEFLGGLLLLRGAHTAHTAKFVVRSNIVKKLSNLRLAPIVFWHGMRWARDNGCRYVDLEGYSSSDQTGHLQLIYRYKSGFNPTEIQVLGQYSITCNRAISVFYKLHLKVKGLSKKPALALFKIRTGFIKRKIKALQEKRN